jgi:hypothetical protein
VRKIEATKTVKREKKRKRQEIDKIVEEKEVIKQRKYMHIKIENKDRTRE